MKNRMMRLASLFLVVFLFCLYSTTGLAAGNGGAYYIQKYNLHQEKTPAGVVPIAFSNWAEYDAFKKQEAVFENGAISTSLNTVLITPMVYFPPVDTANVKEICSDYYAYLESEVGYTFHYNDAISDNEVMSINYKSIYFKANRGCTWDQEAYTASIYNSNKEIKVYVRGNVTRHYTVDGIPYSELIKRVNTTYYINAGA